MDTTTNVQRYTFAESDRLSDKWQEAEKKEILKAIFTHIADLRLASVLGPLKCLIMSCRQ